MKHKQHDFANIITLLVVVVTALVVLGGYITVKEREKKPVQVTQPSKISTSTLDISSWKTYRNEQYGFEFRYPEGWEITEREAKKDYDTIVFLWKKSGKHRIIVGTNPVISVVIVYRALEQERIRRESSDIQFNYSGILVSGRKGYASAVLPGVEGQEVKEVLVGAGNNRTFIITTENAVNVFEQILSTFKFIESSSNSGVRKISWEDAIVLLRDCQVVGGSQTHNRSVGLELRSGEWVVTVEPQLDLVFREIEKNVSTCGDISYKFEIE